MKYKTIKPKYVHYCKKWVIDWFTISLRRNVFVSPHEVRTYFIFAILGFGFKITFRNKYILEWQKK